MALEEDANQKPTGDAHRGPPSESGSRGASDVEHPPTARPPEVHDVLVIPAQTRAQRTVDDKTPMTRFPVSPDGTYKDAPSIVEETDPGARKLYNLARPPGGDHTIGKTHGPAFAVLPLREDPASQFGTCFVVNAENLQLPNAWTAAEWDDGPLGPEYEELWGEEGFEMLVAGPQGKVYHVNVSAKGARSIHEIDLHGEAEIWSQLREGLIVGRVGWRAQKKVIPLVNVTSLQTVAPKEGGAS